MRKLRRILVPLVVLGALVSFGASAPSASAACTYATGALYNPKANHNLDIPQEIKNCVGVDMIRFFGANYGVGEYDLTAGGPLNPVSSASTFQNSTPECGANCVYEVQIPYNGNSAKMWHHQWCWFFGGTHWIKNRLAWSWRSRSSQAWSGVIISESPPYPLAC